MPLIDMLKEAVLRTGCLKVVTSAVGRGALAAEDLAQRLLAIYGYGTNTGIRAAAAGPHGHSEDDIRYVRRRYLTTETARAIAVEMPTPPSPPASRPSGVPARPRWRRTPRTWARSTGTSSPSGTRATAGAGC